MSEHILALENVSKRFGSVLALQNITMRLKEGEVHCLLGDNGAGKSTLIKTLAGVHKPTDGQYLVDGKPVVFNSPSEALDMGVATVSRIWRWCRCCPWRAISSWAASR